MTKTDLEFNKNEDQLKQLLFQLRSREKKIKLGGGEKKIEEQLEKAYDEMLYPGAFCNNTLIDYTKKIYSINIDNNLSHKEKTDARINLTAQFNYAVSESDIKKFNSFLVWCHSPDRSGNPCFGKWLF